MSPEGVDPDEQAAHAKGLKVHIREVPAGGLTFRVVTLRAATTARFSTNLFHDTWHILTSAEGVAVLGRLLWGLAFQRERGTVVLIDGEHLAPTPFDADRSDPILLVPAGLTPSPSGALRALRAALRRPPTPGFTARFHTFGLPRALADRSRNLSLWTHREHHEQRIQERMSRVSGFICYTATPDVLRARALGIYRMRKAREMAYDDLADERRHQQNGPEGEVQMLPDYEDRVAVAIEARREVQGDRPNLTSVADRHAVWDRAEEALARLRESRADGSEENPSESAAEDGA